MILDLVLICGAVIAIGIGYVKGLIASLLSLIGYFGGALAALYGAMRFTESWKGTSIVLVYLIAILIGASIGRQILSRIGRGIHKKFLFGPFRFIDSLGGGLLSFLQFSLLVLLVLSVARYLPIHSASQWISESKIYRRISEVNLLSFRISDLLKSISSHLGQLKS